MLIMELNNNNINNITKNKQNNKTKIIFQNDKINTNNNILKVKKNMTYTEIKIIHNYGD